MTIKKVHLFLISLWNTHFTFNLFWFKFFFNISEHGVFLTYVNKMKVISELKKYEYSKTVY